MTEQEANEAIDKICDWIKKGCPGTTKYEKDVFESIRAETARDMCWQLLDAAEADGLNGCSLCQG